MVQLLSALKAFSSLQVTCLETSSCCFAAVVIGSVKAQLQASASNVKLLDLLHFNPEGAIDTTRAVGVAWIPGTNASLFAGAHQSGNIYLYQPVRLCHNSPCYAAYFDTAHRIAILRCLQTIQLLQRHLFKPAW